MALKGEAKKVYQREYMRRRRSNRCVRPSGRPLLDPTAAYPGKQYVYRVDADGQPIPDYG